MRTKIAAVVFPGFELLDLFGPLELLALVGEDVSISIISKNLKTIRSGQGPSIVADSLIEDAFEFDLLLIPGGIGTRKEVDNTPFINSLARLAEECDTVATVCTGSALLARTGLLDAKQATSNKIAFDWVTRQNPKVQWLRKARWVVDGKFYTSSGVAAEMDMTVALIRDLFGNTTAREVIRKAEYSWNEDSEKDPFA